LDRHRVEVRPAPPEPRAEGGAGGVVVDDERRPPAGDDPVELAQAGLAPRAEEVGPPGVDDVDRAVAQRELLGGATDHGDVPEAVLTDPCRRPARQGRVRLHPDHLPRLRGEVGQVVAGAAAEVEDAPPRPVRHRPHRGPDGPVGVDRAVLDLVDVRVVPDVRAGDDLGRLPVGPGHAPPSVATPPVSRVAGCTRRGSSRRPPGPPRDSRWASQWATSTSYASGPTSSTSSDRRVRKTGSAAVCASGLPVQYQSRSWPPGPHARRSYSVMVISRYDVPSGSSTVR